MEAVAELDYVPNTIAQGLRNHSTKTIAVVLGSIKNNYCNALVYAIEKEAMKRDYNVLICNTHENLDKEIKHLQTIRSRQVDGVILISVYTCLLYTSQVLRQNLVEDKPAHGGLDNIRNLASVCQRLGYTHLNAGLQLDVYKRQLQSTPPMNWFWEI